MALYTKYSDATSCANWSLVDTPLHAAQARQTQRLPICSLRPPFWLVGLPDDQPKAMQERQPDLKKPDTKAEFSAIEWLFRVPSSSMSASPSPRAPTLPSVFTAASARTATARRAAARRATRTGRSAAPADVRAPALLTTPSDIFAAGSCTPLSV